MTRHLLSALPCRVTDVLIWSEHPIFFSPPDGQFVELFLSVSSYPSVCRVDAEEKTAEKTFFVLNRRGWDPMCFSTWF